MTVVLPQILLIFFLGWFFLKYFFPSFLSRNYSTGAGGQWVRAFTYKES